MSFRDFFDPDFFARILTDYGPYFKNGLLYTITLTLFAILVGLVFAMFLTVLRMSKFRVVRFIGTAYVEYIRATPMLVQLMLIYYGVFSFIPMPDYTIFGFIKTQVFIPGVVSVAMNSAAYIAEIIRAGILAVDPGQTEACRSLGMTQLQNMRYIILPQAVKNILPALANEFVTVIKESSICMVIGIPELMFNANLVKGATYRAIEPMIIASMLYFVITFPTSKLIAYIERRMRRGDKR